MNDTFTIDQRGQRITLTHLSPELQSAAVDALRAAVPKICVFCRVGTRPLDHHGNHGDPLYPCAAQAEHAVLALVDAEAR